MRRLRLGLLQADSVLPEFQPAFGNYPGMFRDLLGRAAADLGVELVVTDWDVQQLQYPDDPAAQDAWLITGSRHSVYDDLPWIRALEDFVATLHARRLPLVGICFGHQLVARVLGGEAAAAPQGWGVGVRHADLLDDPPGWLQPRADCLSLVASHRDQVLALPDGARRLAGSDFCPNSAYVVGEPGHEHIFCVQGHPEFSAAYAAALMTNRRALLGEDIWRTGMLSLADRPNHDLVAQWILRFIDNALGA